MFICGGHEYHYQMTMPLLNRIGIVIYLLPKVYKAVRVMLKWQVLQCLSHFVVYHELSIEFNYYTFEV